jgi:hypothetical protein
MYLSLDAVHLLIYYMQETLFIAENTATVFKNVM